MKFDNKPLRVIATDLDGTLLPHGGQFHANDLDALIRLGEQGIVRIIATGRSLWSAQKVLHDDFPIDYLVFSSGAGIYCWKEKRLLHSYSIPFEDVRMAMNLFKAHNLAFTLHHKSPFNHQFYYHKGTNPHPNLFDYLSHYHPHGTLMHDEAQPGEYSQLLAFMPNKALFDQLRPEIVNMKTVRATSPIDNSSIWLECFNPKVSKANGIEMICQQCGISPDQVGVIGNDYNDLDMLNAFAHAGVVNNAPDELTKQFLVMPSVNDAGFSHFVASSVLALS